jgi:hypothetical protein
MKTTIVQFLAQFIKRASGKGSGVERKPDARTAAQNSKSAPPRKGKQEPPKETVAALIKRGQDLRDECSNVSATINPTDVSSWEIECRTFIDQNQTAGEQAIAEQLSHVPINVASLPAPRDGYFVTIVHTLQHLTIISKRLNGVEFMSGSNHPLEKPNTP